MKPNRAVEALRWYVRERQGELGLKGCTYEPSPGARAMMASEGISDRAYAVADRARKVKFALDQMSEIRQKVLIAAHGDLPVALRRERAALKLDDVAVLAVAAGGIEVLALRGPELESLRKRARVVLNDALGAFEPTWVDVERTWVGFASRFLLGVG